MSRWCVAVLFALSGCAAGPLSLEMKIQAYRAHCRPPAALLAQAPAAATPTASPPAPEPAEEEAPQRGLVGEVGHILLYLPYEVWQDTKATAANPVALGLLAAAGISGAAIRSTDWDDRAADHSFRHGSALPKFWDTFGDVAGNPALHFPLTGAMIIGSIAADEPEHLEKSKTLLNALALNGALTLALKWSFRTESPNGNENGWPSGHSSSSFCFATVMTHNYGPWVGAPLLALATFVAYERVDARNHDLSDVVSGSLIGIAIGHAVAAHRQPKVLGMTVLPYADPQNRALGVMLFRSW